MSKILIKVVEEERVEYFEQACNKLLNDGYKIQSSGVKIVDDSFINYYYAIMVRESDKFSKMKVAMEEFTHRVEVGEIRSTKTYNKFKKALLSD